MTQADLAELELLMRLCERINRLEAENERLKAERDTYRQHANGLREALQLADPKLTDELLDEVGRLRAEEAALKQEVPMPSAGPA